MTPYVPDILPLRGLDYQLLFGLVGDASSELARYDGLLQGIPNPEVMLSPLTTKEAVLSSKIEGTQATVDEVLEQEAGLLKEGDKYKDIQEISNYRSALFQASEYLKDYPIRLSVVRELHKTLLSGVRGQDKTPGEFRLNQNWIGREGCSIEEATFVPPNPLRLNEFLQDWEQYLDYVENNFLLQTAIIHAQFELIHPFKDGNGRIGRILIPLFLYQKKQLSQPMFYLSEYLEANRDEYYQRLGNISGQQDWNGWIAFFLRAIAHQAKDNSHRVKKIMELYDEMKVKVREVTRSQYSVYLLDAIFNKPIFSSSDLIKQFNQDYEIHEKTTPGLLRQLRDANILKTLRKGSGRRPSVLCFPRLINLAEGKNIF
ncbi:MAG: Fic family protein [Alphaproteobacteria bacterium]|nr:Fic family protein [Alphaproteobacteria bacterium]